MDNIRNGFYIGKNFFSLDKKMLPDIFWIKSSPYDYQVRFVSGRNPFGRINAWFKSRPNDILFIDRNVLNLYRNHSKVARDRVFAAKADENFKTMTGMLQLIDFLRKKDFSKSDNLVVVGGGVVQDVAALAAGLYKRGIPWVFFPTTLLSMCDSCIGAKAGINYRLAKNQLGLFCAPKEVYIDVNFLKTLDARQILSGLGEVYKLCVSGGKRAYRAFLKNLPNGKVKSLQNYEKLIKLALSVKKLVIETDEFDGSYRKSLNYGHTFGHALEALTHYEVPHGQAVVAGMLIVNELSTEQGLLDRQENWELQRLAWQLLDQKSLQAIRRVPIGQLGKILRLDKKVSGNSLNLVLLKTVGRLLFYPVKTNGSFLLQVRITFKKLFL